MLRSPILVLVAGLLTTIAMHPARAGFLGSTVTGTGFDPNLSTMFSGPATAIVSSAVEFPAGPTPTFLSSNGQVDITDMQIIWLATAAATYGPGSFNGFVFDFAGAPTIVGVTLDAATTLPATGFSFTSNGVSLDLAGQTATIGGETPKDKTILDVQFASSTVPEPGILALLGISLFGVRFFRNRRGGV